MPDTETQTFDIVLRERRQVTLPAEICATLGLQTGDRLEAHLQDDTLVIKPKKALALRALREIQAAFAASGMSEEDLQESGRQIRESFYRERYGPNAPHLP